MACFLFSWQVPGTHFDQDNVGSSIAYERLLPFLNRQPLEMSIAESAKESGTWITVPRNVEDDTHVWLVWSALRAALSGSGTFVVFFLFVLSLIRVLVLFLFFFLIIFH